MAEPWQDRTEPRPDEYIGPLCPHVCFTCGGCAACCNGHNEAPAFSDDLAEAGTCGDCHHGPSDDVRTICECPCHGVTSGEVGDG